MGPVAAGLERVNANNLLACETGRECKFCVGPLEFHFAARPLRHKTEILLRGFEEIRNDRNVFPWWNRGLGRALLSGSWRRRGRGRTRITWRLRQHIIVKH